ncbi:DUF5340 domain-containing protein [Acaryochloris sp. IP29b_bin.137]|uniref:DUF5340 domain-containing protein n=1 Tax=Acaryochloris sp. IP29b_bin.137 TaxID=2969217 RepID=UPI002608752A|nr:DUF5340 domain-containing protein [Acaryochloris sp. IP29b_bin.137]
MGTLPLPSHIHYELLLQILERQTLPSLNPTSSEYSQAQQVVVSLRKALSHQKALEAHCRCSDRQVEHRWSLNDQPIPKVDVR